MRLLRLSVILVLCSSAFGATHYIWCGASGAATGNDFTNAKTTIPASLVRGDTYVVAGSNSCTYLSGSGNVIFQDAESGTTVITVRHASSTLDSAVAGYISTFATTQARFKATGNFVDWIIKRGYYTIDGNPDQTGNGLGNSSCLSNCGFLLQDNVDLKTGGFIELNCSSGCTNITIKGVEIDNSGVTIQSSTCTNGIAKDGTGAVNNILLKMLYVHDIAGGHIGFTTGGDSGFTVTQSYLARGQSSGGCHGESIAFQKESNFTLSYNLIEDCDGTACVSIQNTTDTSSGNIYGNVFNTTNDSLYHVGTGVVVCINSQVCNPLNFFNNTIVGFTGASGTVAHNSYGGGGSGSTVTQYNNLYYNDQAVATGSGCSGCTVTNDYNCYEATTDSSNPSETHACTGSTNYFVNVASDNFHLALETPSSPNGLNTNSLVAANTTDPDGVNRSTADGGTWSRGASAFVSGTPQVATPTFSPVAGTYTTTQTVTISTVTGGATICYTTDGSTPTANGAGTCTHGTTYSGTVSVAVSETLKAIGSLSGDTDSLVGSAAYVINPVAATPTFSPIAGTYVGPQAVTPSTTSGGAIICYSTVSSSPATNGSTGCSVGTLHTTPITISSSATLYAVAGGTGFTDSAVGSAAYTITSAAASGQLLGGARVNAGGSIH